MHDCGGHALADSYAEIDAWRLIVEILRLVPTATVTEYADEIDGSVLAVSDPGWGRCMVRLDRTGIQIVAPVLCEPWPWPAYRQQETPRHFARLLVRSLGASAPGPQGPLSAEAASLIAGALALGLATAGEWYARSLRPAGIETANYAHLFPIFPGLLERALDRFEVTTSTGAKRDPEVDGWVVYCDLQPTLLVLTGHDPWVTLAPALTPTGCTPLLAALVSVTRSSA